MVRDRFFGFDELVIGEVEEAEPVAVVWCRLGIGTGKRIKSPQHHRISKAEIKHFIAHGDTGGDIGRMTDA